MADNKVLFGDSDEDSEQEQPKAAAQAPAAAKKLSKLEELVSRKRKEQVGSPLPAASLIGTLPMPHVFNNSTAWGLTGLTAFPGGRNSGGRPGEAGQEAKAEGEQARRWHRFWGQR